jgi:hypothetical protein
MHKYRCRCYSRDSTYFEYEISQLRPGIHRVMGLRRGWRAVAVSESRRPGVKCDFVQRSAQMTQTLQIVLKTSMSLNRDPTSHVHLR